MTSSALPRLLQRARRPAVRGRRSPYATFAPDADRRGQESDPFETPVVEAAPSAVAPAREVVAAVVPSDIGRPSRFPRGDAASDRATPKPASVSGERDVVPEPITSSPVAPVRVAPSLSPASPGLGGQPPDLRGTRSDAVARDTPRVPLRSRAEVQIVLDGSGSSDTVVTLAELAPVSFALHQDVARFGTVPTRTVAPLPRGSATGAGAPLDRQIAVASATAAQPRVVIEREPHVVIERIEVIAPTTAPAAVPVDPFASLDALRRGRSRHLGR